MVEIELVILLVALTAPFSAGLLLSPLGPTPRSSREVMLPAPGTLVGAGAIVIPYPLPFDPPPPAAPGCSPWPCWPIPVSFEKAVTPAASAPRAGIAAPIAPSPSLAPPLIPKTSEDRVLSPGTPAAPPVTTGGVVPPGISPAAPPDA